MQTILFLVDVARNTLTVQYMDTVSQNFIVCFVPNIQYSNQLNRSNILFFQVKTAQSVVENS